MNLRLRPLLRLLRTLVMGMLVLAIVAKPVLAELCDAHVLAHLIAQGEAKDGPLAKHVDSAAEARSDRDHASGAHQGLHASDASPAWVEPFPAITVPPARFAHAALPVHEALAPAARAFDSPFRPPIA